MYKYKPKRLKPLDLKRLCAFALLFCMVLGLLPPVHRTYAAESDANYHYELDTDGIDVGETYLIVAGTKNGIGSHALRVNPSALTVSVDQRITVTNNKIAAGFDNERYCQWVFSSSTSGTVKSNGLYLDIEQYTHYSNSSATLKFAKLDNNGAYGIYLHGGRYTNLQYLYHSTSSDRPWNTGYKYGKNGTDSSAYENGYVYLFKKVESAYSITYNQNRPSTTHDSFSFTGTFPANGTYQAGSSAYTVQAPSDGMMLNTYNASTPHLTDTYTFTGWNTSPDGLGTAYQPGAKITPSSNLTLYAQWHPQTKYVVSVLTHQDGIKSDFTDLPECEGKELYIKETASNAYLPLTRTAEGTYLAYVTANGNYQVFASADGANFEPVYEHQVVIYNLDGSTDIHHYSLSYDTAGGSWNGPSTPSIHYVNSQVTVNGEAPTREGYFFKGWSDGNEIYQPGATFHITGKTTLTAIWENTIDVTVNITIIHDSGDAGYDNSDSKGDVTFQLLKEVNGVNQPWGTPVSLPKNADLLSNTTTYTYKYSDLVPGVYNLSTSKSGYAVEITKPNDNTINVIYTYTPTNFDLYFDVCVDGFDSVPQALRPTSANVKVTYWGYNSQNVLGWHTITQQENSAPTTVSIDSATGKGSGFYSVWQTWDQDDYPYYYRVEVTSFVMPDGSVIPADSNNHVTYTSDQSGLYTATVSVTKPNGITNLIPTYPDGSSAATALDGAYYDVAAAQPAQIGRPVVTIKVNPFTVSFDPGEGTLDGSNKDVVLSNQYLYPDLDSYVPAPPADSALKFSGWLVNGVPAENLEGNYLTGNVVYTAKYTSGMTFTGTITAAGTYDQDGDTVIIKDPDRINKVMVVLQKGINGVFNDFDSAVVSIVYPNDRNLPGTGTYTFTQVPEDGSEYQIHVLTLNYSSQYDNNGDGIPSPEESAVITDSDAEEKVVDAYLSHDPQSYSQNFYVDASRINKNHRPNVTVQILYRDLASSNPYAVISQHTVEPYGVPVELNASGYGSGSDSVWNFHNNGALYEYQAALYGASSELPYTAEYGRPAFYLNGSASRALQVNLIPKEYEIVLDLGEGVDPATVQGVDEYHIDTGSQGEHFAYIHTWSFEDNFTAFPYREGYVFKGWTTKDPGVSVSRQGYVTVGATLDHSVTLTATWEALGEGDYTVRHLELNTDQVLTGAQAITNSSVGQTVTAVGNALTIPGYVYVGAMIDGVYYDRTENPALTIKTDPTANLITVYYLPDGSDGYTDQVESNLKLNKSVVLEDNGTYTIKLETHTLDNPITTQILQNTPMDIVLVLDQSGSIINSGYLDELQSAVNNFIAMISDHGLKHKVDHRIGIVGYAGNATEAPTSTNTSTHPIAGGTTSEWVNTGVFDSNGEFHPYPVTGFNFTAAAGNPTTSDTFYIQKDGEYLLLTFHDAYYHLITDDEAHIEAITGSKIFGYVDGRYVELERNSSGLWLYENEQLYSQKEFFTYHKDVWTHRSGMEGRQIHAYGTGSSYKTVDGHSSTVYTRDDIKTANPDLSIYKDALVPVSVGDGGTGGVNPGLITSSSHLGSNGGTYVQYGIEMANSIFAANPLPEGNPEGRIRIMVTFTDGMPGIGTFDAGVANEAIAEAYVTKNEHDVYSYAIGLYKSSTEMNQTYFMNAISSNYPDAENLNDVMLQPATNITRLETNGTYYVKQDGVLYELDYDYNWSFWGGTTYSWTFKVGNKTTSVSTEQRPTVTNGMIGDFEIYTIGGAPDESAGYYSTTSSVKDLEAYFTQVVTSITTKITKEIVLHDDTIIRDIMGQGLVLTPGTVITAYQIPGIYNQNTGKIDWSSEKNQVASLTIPENPADVLHSNETANIIVNEATGETKDVPYISVYNLQSSNPTDPHLDGYHPHTVDITGYDFEHWYIDDKHPEGHKMLVEITRVEARDDVVWGRATATNDSVSGLWLPADANGKRELLLPFDRLTTLFVERTYVLDYGKSFTLGDWYFDESATGRGDAEAIHVDCIIDNGMNWFADDAPNTSNSTAANATYGNTRYGNVKVVDGEVVYTPVTTNWDGYDQFYVFGETWRDTVTSQDANFNGNLWSKVTVIPANNVYYEDSFLTTADTAVNGTDGFVFSTTGWIETVSDESAGENMEHAESMETGDYAGVHGWTDSLTNDQKFTDGSAHFTNTMGASSSFTFTGTGVDVYTRTNSTSGLIVATLSKLDEDGKATAVESAQGMSQVIDNLAVSGDYYHVPTVSFKKLPYGTYRVTLIATAASAEVTGSARYEYYLDGIRVYTPLGSDQRAADTVVKEAYGLELNAVFTEVRDILLDYNDFNKDIADGTDKKMGAVFIDWIRAGQGTGNDTTGEGVPTYEIATYTTLGPKNEVYLSSGQAIVIKVDPELENNYYIGLKSLTGAAVNANVSGIDLTDAKQISISHTTDLYYKVAPTDGYIVIQNGSDAGILSVTKLRTTNMDAPNEGIVPVNGSDIAAISDLIPLFQQAVTIPKEEEPLSPEETLIDSISDWLENE